MVDFDDGLLQSVPAASEVVQWFGYWPSFHDAEIISLSLNRSADSILQIHTFHTLPEVNEQGHYRTAKHAVVCFFFSEIQALKLNDFNVQNVISALLSKSAETLTITLGCCFGLCGYISAKNLRIALAPGIPSSSMYGNPGDLST